jgi:hypothetical protein
LSIKVESLVSLVRPFNDSKLDPLMVGVNFPTINPAFPQNLPDRDSVKSGNEQVILTAIGLSEVFNF